MPTPMQKEFALRHQFNMWVQVKPYSATNVDYATYLPLYFADQAKTEDLAMDVQVNRANDNYENIVNTPACYMNSRIDNIKITEYARKHPLFDNPDAIFYKNLTTFGLGDVDATDPQGNTLISKLKFKKNSDTLGPIYNGIKFGKASYVHADVDGLTTNQKLEPVDIRPYELLNHRNGSLGPKVKAVSSRPVINRVHADQPFFRERWYETPSKAKRMLAFTGCWLYMGVNKQHDATPSATEEWFSPYLDENLTVEEASHVYFIQVEFNEKNDAFQQSA